MMATTLAGIHTQHVTMAISSGALGVPRKVRGWPSRGRTWGSPCTMTHHVTQARCQAMGMPPRSAPSTRLAIDVLALAAWGVWHRTVRKCDRCFDGVGRVLVRQCDGVSGRHVLVCAGEREVVCDVLGDVFAGRVPKHEALMNARVR